MTVVRNSPRSVDVQYGNREDQRNNSGRNEEAEPKWKPTTVVDMFGGKSKIWCYKEQYCTGTWNVRSMNQDNLEAVEQGMAKVSINILEITELKWMGIGEFKFSSAAQSCPTICKPMNCSMPGLPVHHQLPEFKQTHVTESVMPSNHFILCHPLLLLPSIFPSIRVFSNESALQISQRKYWNFSFNINPSNEHPGLISFRMDWLALLAVQGTFKSLQHHSTKATILQYSAFFILQLSHPYMITGKAIALAR